MNFLKDLCQRMNCLCYLLGFLFSSLIIKSLNYFEFIFVYSVRNILNLFFYIQLHSYPVLKKKKTLNELDYYNDVVSYPEPDIFKCEVKWTLRSTAVKASGCDGIPAELFKSLKDDAIKFCIHYVTKSGRLSSGHKTGKGRSSSPNSRRVVPKNVLAIRQLHSSHVLVRSCLKSCLLGFSTM